jgi:hypothetical protein
MNKHHEIPASHFNKKVLKALTKKGIAIIGMTTIPGNDGSYATGFTGYELDDNGTGRVRSYLQVEALAK